jgi:hypothetical protein
VSCGENDRSRGGFLVARHRQLCVGQAHIDILALSTPSAAPSRNRGDE